MVVPLESAVSLEDLYTNPLVYERADLMKFIRGFDREKLRNYYLHQPKEGAYVYANYVVNLWEYERGVEELTSRPWNVAIPLTEVCNAKCTFCTSPLVLDPKAIRVHEIEHFAEALRYALRVSLQGLGEPLAHPDFELIANELKRHLNPVALLEMITNGWLLSGRRWELLKSIQISDLQVSVNAATDTTHQIAMGSKPGTFDQVVKNIETVLSDPDWPRCLKTSMVITRHSLPEAVRFLDLFAAKGVKIFQFNPLLPLETPGWGWGRENQYVDLWCGHLPNAPELVEEVKRAIDHYRANGMNVTATPEQWLIPVDQWRQREVIQLNSVEERVAAYQRSASAQEHEHSLAGLFITVDDKKAVLLPHDRHTTIEGSDGGAVHFSGTAAACRWAYLLLTPPTGLSPGEYSTNLEIDVLTGTVYAGVLDVEKNEFIVQEQLHSKGGQVAFSLERDTLVQVVIRQGDQDAPVSGTYRRATVNRASHAEVKPEPVLHTIDPPVAASGTPVATSQKPSTPALEEGTAEHGPVKSGRIYCPMVYTTLSVFHHSLAVSICCYMENAPGQPQPNLKGGDLLTTYNAEGFRKVRETLTTGNHLPICVTCPYGDVPS